MFSPDRFDYGGGERPTMQERRTYRRRRDRRLFAQDKQAGIDQECPNSKDGRGHCVHWWDGDGCCWCQALAMTRAEMVEQGMVEETTHHEGG